MVIACGAKVDWTLYEDREYFFYNDNDGIFVALPAVASIVHRNTASVEVAESSQTELLSKYDVKYKDRDMTLELVMKA